VSFCFLECLHTPCQLLCAMPCHFCKVQRFNAEHFPTACRLPSFVTTLQVMGDRIFVGDLQVSNALGAGTCSMC
jgi:hypothetical protein